MTKNQVLTEYKILISVFYCFLHVLAYVASSSVGLVRFSLSVESDKSEKNVLTHARSNSKNCAQNPSGSTCYARSRFRVSTLRKTNFLILIISVLIKKECMSDV